MRYLLPIDYGQFELYGMQLELGDGSAELPGLILDVGVFDVCIERVSPRSD